MATGQINGVVRYIRRIALGHGGGGLTDGELLKRFVVYRDEAAFAALVRRYGPLVLGVCRRVLQHKQDAEDAFQATFLVLLHKAGTIVQPELVGNWLYGVAYFTAKNAKASAARRRNRERQVREMSRRQAVSEEHGSGELRPLLDEELSRLPEKYRVPVVLCELQGKSRKEVARHLGCAVGTVSSRLARARQMLRKRLTKRGLALSAGSLAVALSRDVVSASVPGPLMASTIKTALLAAASPAAAAGIVSGPVAALTEGVLKGMFLGKLKNAIAVLLVIGVVAGAGLFAHETLAERTHDRQQGSQSLGKEDMKPGRADPKPAKGPLNAKSSPEEPQAVIQKALQAIGGEGLARQIGAIHFKLKGVHHGRGGTFSYESFAQLPNYYKDVEQFLPHGMKAGTTPDEIAVLDGQKAWWGDGQTLVEVQGADLVAMQNTAYALHVATLVPLLDGNGYQLSLLKPQQVEGRPAIGVLVTAQGRPDVNLYFDQATSLLAKIEFGFNGVLEERFFSDYREVNSPAMEEKTLKAAGLATDTPALFEYLRQKTVTKAEQEKNRALIRDLGASSFNVRERATNELIARGTAVVRLLSQAVNDQDPEIASRAKRCLETIGKHPDTAVPGAVVRLLALRKSAGAAEVLLAYLPSAPDESVADQVQAALIVLAFPDGKPEAALVRALEDKDPSRRAAARVALGRDAKTARPGQRLILPGYKKAMKVALHRDRKKLMEWGVTEVELFNKLDPQVLRDFSQLPRLSDDRR